MTRTFVTYFNKQDADDLLKKLAVMEDNLLSRMEFIPSEHFLDAHDRLEAVRLAVKRLDDCVPE